MRHLFIVFIVICVLVILYKLIETIRIYKKCSEKVDAVVVDMELREDVDKDTLYAPVYQFHYNFREYRVKNKELSETKCKKMMQRHFKLRIDPNNPTKVFDVNAQIKSAVVFIMIPLVFIIMMLVIKFCR
ncbi:MAG: DUF3592 domain-containing protein [Ruminococcus sp.]|uniref:DUF3592 domain-containing protein n=1 Tax=Ruminococcus sp. TaxID=41978 RepID=UPI0025DB29B5|nr:DUF3592 domain-containing protein [Ruminococcus sp.]MCR5599623.1 DUF3592 domain-containing protein [Ruminococcus sp.]